MSEQHFGPRRSWATRKPWPECPDVTIYRCNHCSRLYQALDYGVPPQVAWCCGSPMERMEPLHLEDVSPEIEVDYKITGGYNENAVQVFWKTKQPEDNPEWVLLKTFTGSYIKYITSEKRPPMVFALADEDAYVYCGQDLCLECVFRCKRGFVIYLYIKTKGVLEVPIERMSHNTSR